MTSTGRSRRSLCLLPGRAARTTGPRWCPPSISAAKLLPYLCENQHFLGDSLRCKVLWLSQPSPTHQYFWSELIITMNVRVDCMPSPQSCPVLWDTLDCSPPGSSVHGILPARMFKWVAISSSRGSSRPRDRTRVSCISCLAGGFFTPEPPVKVAIV